MPITRWVTLYRRVLDHAQLSFCRQSRVIRHACPCENLHCPLEKLRRYCPCAGCQGEVDVMGQLHKGPDKPLSANAFVLTRIQTVGGYAIQPLWADGHGSGLFSFDYLRRLADSGQ